MSHRVWTATLEDGTEVLIELWPGNAEWPKGGAPTIEPDTLTIATREQSFHSWGPPIQAEEK